MLAEFENLLMCFVQDKHLEIGSTSSFADAIFLSFHQMTFSVHLGHFDSAWMDAQLLGHV